MAQIVYHPTPPTRRVGTLTVNSLKHWAPALGMWGIGLGTAALFFLSVTPKVKYGLLVKLPVIGKYYEDKIPQSDKPF
ncbi:hypothetical protein EWM64_g1721 [Hericium alpestre]|uniref:QCR10 domain-containing protein n=1 Tax=Hericium alpestre TaxID=135208 RepID=A0A4Z0A728_9AGAM|nr:hypothetical protein EWM64_g1721 [Hericium alpestre]